MNAIETLRTLHRGLDSSGIILGVDTTGADDSTEAVQAFIDAGARVVPLVGTVKTSALTFPQHPVRVEIHGEWILTDTQVLPARVDVVGCSGGEGGQFAIGQRGLIRPPEGKAALVLAGAHGQLLKDFAILDCSAEGIVLDGDGALGALCRMENVSVRAANNPAAVPLRIKSFFWVYIHGCTFMATADGYPATIDIRSAGGAHNNYSYSGFIRLSETIFSHHGVRVENNSSALLQGFRVERCEYENGLSDFFTVADAGGGITDIEIIDTNIADPINDVYILRSSGDVRNVTIDCSTSVGAIIHPQSAPIVNLRVDVRRLYTYEVGTAALPALMEKGAIITANGRHQGNDSPGLVGSPVPQIPLLTPTVGGDVSTEVAPDGTLTAFAVGGVPDTYVRLCDSQTEIDVGDWIIVGYWLRGLTTDKSPTGATLAFDGVAGVALDGGTYWVRVAEDDDLLAVRDGAWRRVCRAYKVTAVGASHPYMRLNFQRRAERAVTAYWAPFLAHIQAGTVPDHQATAWARSQAIGPSRPGVLAALPHQCLVSGRGPTSERPDAAAVGDGAQWYDATLDLPLWSNGAIWRTACGTPV